MATFTAQSTNNSNYTLRLAVTENGTNVASNTSAVSWELWLDSTYARFDNYTVTAVVVLDGVTVYSNTSSRSMPARYESLLLGSGTAAIAHNADGSKSIACAASISMQAVSYTPGNVSAGGTMALAAIPRATVPIADTTAIGNTMTIRLPRASADFTHQVLYYFGSLSGTLAEAAGDQLQWTIPMDFCAQLPNATSGTVQISCNTYNGGTYVGNAVISATLTVLPSVVPAIGAVQLRPVNDLAVLDGVYVKGFSKVGYTVTASAPYGASVTACNVTLGSVSGGGTSGTTGVLTTAGTLIPAVTVKDSRGRTATRTLNAITVEDYFLPSVFGFSARRCTANGTDSDSGAYLKIACTANCAAAGGRNSAALRARYCASGGAFNSYAAITGPTAILGGDLAVNRSYTVEVSVTDTLGGSAAVTENIATAAVTVNIREGGKGIGVGKYAESDALEVGLPAAFLAALQVGGVDLNGIRDFITETGVSGGWTYIKLKSGLKLCWTVFTFTTDVNYAVGGSYYSQNYFGGGAFPSGFFTQDPLQLPVLQEASATVISLQTGTAGNRYTTGSWYFSRPVPAAGVTGKVAVLAIGR